MFRFIVRRSLWAIPTLLIVTFLVFVAIRIGTDPVQSYLRLNPRATEAKVQQYTSGERFVRRAVELAGMDGFNRIWRDEHNLPTGEEVVDPARWVSRVVGA